jgi:hypothetical protein
MDILRAPPRNLVLLLEAVAAAGLTYAVYKYIKRQKRINKRKAYPKDVVILHQFPRGARAPSVSPFPIKLETWLRITGIKYQVLI